MLLYRESNSQDEIPLFLPKVVRVDDSYPSHITDIDKTGFLNLGGAKSKHALDRVGDALATLVAVHSSLCNELEQLHNHAMAADLFVEKLFCQRTESQSDCFTVHSELASRYW